MYIHERLNAYVADLRQDTFEVQVYEDVLVGDDFHCGFAIRALPSLGEYSILNPTASGENDNERLV